VAVACLSDRFCALVAEDGRLAIWEGEDWTGQQSFGPPVPGPGPAGVSCSQTWACTAVLGGQVLTWDGDSWTEAPYPDLAAAAVSCPGASRCIFAGGHDVVVRSNGIWQPPEVVDPTGLLADLSCPTVSFCVAIDDTGRALTFEGTRWSPPRAVLPDDSADGIGVKGLYLVDCPSARFCLAVSPGGSATTFLPADSP
jgi:hypothetical protein